MNINIARIKQLEHQSKSLSSIMEAGEYMAAGISLNLCVGPRRDEDEGLELQLSEFLPELLERMGACLQRQIAFRRQLARQELNELHVFLGE